MRQIKCVLVLVTMFLCGGLHAQYYDWGRSPSSIKWDMIKSPYNHLVFPQEYTRNAVRVMHYLDTVRTQIAFGYRHGVMRTPVVMHTQNFIPNGIVMLAPKRMEFIVMPGGAESATTWLKQLSVHEYRHSVQFNNLNRGLIKILSYPLGQQGSLIGGALLPSWFMEGDAVLAETQMTTFGRGLQPSFTMAYRAMYGEGVEGQAMDKFFCGSYKDYMPDHYQLGYQIVSWADNHYGENMGDKMARFGARNPYMFFTSTIAIHKYYRTTVDKMFVKTFDDLHAHWSRLPKEPNSATIITTPTTSYTTYISPVRVSDTTVVAIKKDLDRYSRIVEIDSRTGVERVLKYTGMVNTSATYADGKLHWSEFRPSAIWAQRVNSVICTYDLKSGVTSHDSGERQSLYPAALPSGKVARLEYNYNGSYSIVCEAQRCDLPDSIALYGLAYDAGRLYFIALSDSGMWIGRTSQIDNEGGRGALSFEMVTRPSYSTLSNLRAGGGRLYFNSIASGKDEVHMYDIAAAKEYQVTRSTYGSFMASPSEVDPNEVMLTTYSTNGYLISSQQVVADSLREVEYSLAPKNIVNPPRRKWDVMNIDTLRVGTEAPENRPVKRYRKALHAINVHSWAPVSIDPERIINEYDFNLYAGVTAMSQNLLASTFAQLSYGWTKGGSMVRGNIKYYGFAPKLELSAQWGGAKQLLINDEKMKDIAIPARDRYFDITGRVYLPLQLSGGYHLRTLIPQMEWTHMNTLMPNSTFTDYRQGVEQLTATLQFTDNVRMAPRDLLPRWGYTLRASYLCNPVRSDFGQVWSGYVRGYTPGVAPHHSLTLRAAYQFQKLDVWNFTRKELFPRGADYNNLRPRRYVSTSMDYQLPLCYPDGGIRSFLYFKRIRANFSFDYARYETTNGRYGNIFSYGGDLIFDLNPFRLPSSVGVEIRVTLHKASTRDGVVVGGEFSLPF